MLTIEFHLRLAVLLTRLLETRFHIGKFRFGYDALVGLIPGLGDVVMTLFAFYLVWIGKKMHLPQEKINLMIRNIVIDFLLGLVPFVGDLADVFYKANTKNLKILKEYEKTNKIIEGEIIS